ncbi:MAG: hypothetical protein FD125_2557 [bacterium]|nr:MAG: hypothetical protein FD125_2557 [bacterium]
MFHRKLLALAGGAIALALIAAQPAFAQDAPPDTTGRTESDRASGTIRGEGVLPGRIGGGRRDRVPDNRATRNRAAPPPAAATPEEIKAAAQALVVATGGTCQVTEATQPGINPEQQKIYEAACSEGPGLILIEAVPPQSFDCLELAGTAYTARLRDPAAAGLAPRASAARSTRPSPSARATPTTSSMRSAAPARTATGWNASAPAGT